MRQLVVIGALVYALARPALADPGKTTVLDGVEQLLMRMEREYSVAYLNHDTATIGRILADDYVGIDGRAVVSDKAEEIEEAKAPRPGTPVPDYLVTDETLGEMKVRAYGDAAVVTSLSTEQVRIRGNASTVQYRRTTVYIKRRERWRLVSFHATRLIDGKK